MRGIIGGFVVVLGVDFVVGQGYDSRSIPMLYHMKFWNLSFKIYINCAPLLIKLTLCYKGSVLFIMVDIQVPTKSHRPQLPLNLIKNVVTLFNSHLLAIFVPIELFYDERRGSLYVLYDKGNSIVLMLRPLLIA